MQPQRRENILLTSLDGLKKQRKQKNHQIARKKDSWKGERGEVAKSAHFATSAFRGNTQQLMEQMGEF